MCHVKITELYKFLDWASDLKAVGIQMLSNTQKTKEQYVCA